MKRSRWMVAGGAFLLGTLALHGAGTLRAQSSESTTQGQDNGPTGPQQQGQRPGPPTPAGELERLSRALTLSDAQKASILPILQHRHDEMQTLRQSGDPSTEHEAMRTLMDTSNKQIRALLTTDQQRIFDSMHSGRPPRSHGGDAGAGQGAAAMPPQPPAQ